MSFQVAAKLVKGIAYRPALRQIVTGSGRTNRSLRFAGWYHSHISPNLPDCLVIHRGETVCYVGTYRPERVALLADAVGPAGHVVVVEAHPGNFEILRTGLAELDIACHVTLLNAAVYKENGTVSFGVYDGLPEHHLIMDHPGQRNYKRPAKQIDVPASTFDDIFHQHSDIRHVYVTINGAELDALEGMTDFLTKSGNSAWIKSPFLNESSGRPMVQDVQEALRDLGLETFLGCGTETQGTAMGKVFAYRPV